MSPATRGIERLPSALDEAADFDRRLAGRTPAVFLDYDGTLTPIVDRPEDAVISEDMREAVRGLAERCPVCVVSGRDRPVVQTLMGLDHLIVAGSHGFDIWSPDGGPVQTSQGGEFTGLLKEVEQRLHGALDPIDGALVEAKKISVAAHYRMVAEAEHGAVKRAVDTTLAEHPDALKCTPGKMVWEVQPKIDWDKGRAVLYLLDALDLDRDEIVPIYLGDDVTDEDAFRALVGRGIGILVGRPDDPELAGRETHAAYALGSIDDVHRFLDSLAR